MVNTAGTCLSPAAEKLKINTLTIKRDVCVMPGYRSASLILLTMQLVFTSMAVAGGDPGIMDGIKRQKVMSMYEDSRREFPEVPDMAAGDAIRLLGRPNITFVDVREPKEQQVSMIPGAVSQRDFLARIDRFRTQTIIVYCTIGYRSGKLALKLRQKGLDVINLKAGLLGWVYAGGAVAQNGRLVKRIHVYGRKWDLAPAAVETVY
jgi:rhodanese-related sulfurtransferase